MKPEQIFVGNIRKCTKYESHTTFQSETYINGRFIGGDGFGYIDTDDELFKENAILIKIEKGGYVDLERLNSILDYVRIYKDIKDGYMLGGLMMPTSPHGIDNLFVDKKSLKPYYSNEQTKNISVHQLKKQLKNSK